MIRALTRWLLRGRYARGGHVGPPAPPGGLLWPLDPSEDDDLDPDDPIVRLVRQARATGDGRIHHYLGDTTTCPTCLQCTQRPVFAHSLGVTHEYAIPIATHCPNCPPEEND